MCDQKEMNKEELKKQIINSLRRQGFRVRGGQISLPVDPNKDKLRNLHAIAVQHKIEKSKKELFNKESRLLKRFAVGAEVIPDKIVPRLIEVQPNTEDELLFRYASLHWSIPVSSGYGRRLRFIVTDEYTGKLIGLFGLGDPVFSLSARDRWVGWDMDVRREKLQHVMDAFVLGAVPPYSSLICGKLIAMLVASNEVRHAFKRKYRGHRTLIRRKILDGQLALITTTSALGRSSIYNRLRNGNNLLYHSVGYTKGSGDFHFANGLYDSIFKYMNRYYDPTAKQKNWGTGFRNRREVVRKCLSALGLSSDWIYHGVQREVFLVPLANNVKEFLKGENKNLEWFNCSAEALTELFKERWLLPRAKRDESYLTFNPETWRLWPLKENIK